MKKLMKNRMLTLLMITAGLVNAAAAEDLQLTTRTVINLDVAKAIAGAASDHARQNDWAVSIAIVDQGTNLVYFERGDGVQIGSTEVAIGKARTAASFQRPTKVLEQITNDGRTTIVSLPNSVLLEGGVPIVWQGQVLGAVGVSGVTSAQDAEVASAGIDAVMQRLMGSE